MAGNDTVFRMFFYAVRQNERGLEPDVDLHRYVLGIMRTIRISGMGWLASLCKGNKPEHIMSFFCQEETS